MRSLGIEDLYNDFISKRVETTGNDSISNDIPKNDILAQNVVSNNTKSSYIHNIIIELKKNGLESRECCVYRSMMAIPVMTPCGHLVCENCVLTKLNNECPVCRMTFKSNKCQSLTEGYKKLSELNRNSKWRSSSKLDTLQKLLSEKLCNQTQTTIIFSQWSLMLDMIQLTLNQAGLQHVRFDGTMSQKQRENSLSKFRKQSNIKVCVMSLKASALGLNLTHASLVILADPWWNPAVEEQAINRIFFKYFSKIHRIGQKNKVEVCRLITTSTVESKMIVLQDKKRRLADSILSAGTGVHQSIHQKLNLEDLKSFFV
eukprot:GSMAST32.ASY1.ANO1.2460.1 assembled CDS